MIALRAVSGLLISSISVFSTAVDNAGSSPDVGSYKFPDYTENVCVKNQDEGTKKKRVAMVEKIKII